MGQTYFHLNSSRLEPGSIILPGNWGRILRLYGEANETLYRELIFELVRRAQFPHKPSRLEATFVVETIEAARYFRDKTQRALDLVYEVELVNPISRLHRGDWVKMKASIPWLDTWPEVAAQYWQGENVENAELVSDSPLRIVRLVG